MVEKTTQFKRLLLSGQPEFVMEAHNGLSATIVQETGFKGIWASGLSISAALGVRDNNEASWTQVLEVVEFMSDATTIPILVDADTGYGNFNNVRRLVRKLEQRAVAGMCVEDKLFPKTNSFIKSERQPLADIEEFAGKIKAAKDTQTDPDFSFVARVEAFIAGWGLGESLRRAEAYHRAGADAILIHSKLSTPDQVLAFMDEWQDTCPVVIVPTTYYNTPVEVFEEAGVSLVIWANQLVRAGIRAFQKTAEQIHRDRSVAAIEDKIAPVREVFRLQKAAELEAAEQQYLPSSNGSVRSILLANNEWSPSNGTPRALVPVRDQPLLERQINQFNASGIKDLIVVSAPSPGIAHNVGFRLLMTEVSPGTSELSSLARVLDQLEGTTIISSGNTLFKLPVLLSLLHEPGDIVIVVESDLDADRRGTRWTNFVRCTSLPVRSFFQERPRLVEFNSAEPHGEWTGMLKLSPWGAVRLRNVMEEIMRHADFMDLHMTDLLDHLLKHESIHVMYINGQWCHIDDLEAISPALSY